MASLNMPSTREQRKLRGNLARDDGRTKIALVVYLDYWVMAWPLALACPGSFHHPLLTPPSHHRRKRLQSGWMPTLEPEVFNTPASDEPPLLPTGPLSQFAPPGVAGTVVTFLVAPPDAC